MTGKHGSLQERLSAKIYIDEDTGCWLWTGYVHPTGYGTIAEGPAGGRCLKAHRVSWELENGPIPDGLEIDHLCRVRHCVNPTHLEPVTRLVNARRGETGKHNAIKTHCPQGHPYEVGNLYSNPKGHRRCRLCVLAQSKAIYWRKRAIYEQEMT